MHANLAYSAGPLYSGILQRVNAVAEGKDLTPTGRITWDFYPLIAEDGANKAIQ